MIQTQEIEEIATTRPGIAVPALVTVWKHLEAWTYITAMMMLFERARADPLTIQ